MRPLCRPGEAPRRGLECHRAARPGHGRHPEPGDDRPAEFFSAMALEQLESGRGTRRRSEMSKRRRADAAIRAAAADGNGRSSRSAARDRLEVGALALVGLGEGQHLRVGRRCPSAGRPAGRSSGHQFSCCGQPLVAARSPSCSGSSTSTGRRSRAPPSSRRTAGCTTRRPICGVQHLVGPVEVLDRRHQRDARLDARPPTRSACRSSVIRPCSMK